MTTMPFGKFKGQPVASLPTSYRTWLLDQPWVAQKYSALVAELRGDTTAAAERRAGFKRARARRHTRRAKAVPR